MKDEFFAITLTGLGSIFVAGFFFCASLGSLLKGDWEAAISLAMLVLLMMSAARSDARSEIKSGTYRGRMFHRREGSQGFTYGDPVAAAKSTGEVSS